MFQNLFNMDKPFWRAMRGVADILILNFIFMISCIPIITIGASVTALYTVTMKMAKDEEPYILRSFWDAFKSNFKQSTIIWLVLFVLGAFLVVDLYLTSAMTVSFMQVLRYVFIFIAVLYLIVLCFVFPVQSKFENSIINTMKNALIFGIAHLIPWTLLIVLLNVLPVVVFIFRADWFLYFVLPLMFFCGFSMIAYINSKMFQRIFKRFIPEEESNDTK